MGYRTRLCILLLTVLWTSPATADILTFTDRASFNAVIEPTTLETFDTIPPYYFDIPGQYRWNIDGVLLAGSDVPSATDIIPGTFCLCFPTSNIGTIDPVWAFGIDLTAVEAPDRLAGITFVQMGQVVQQSRLVGEPQFLGFVFNTPTFVAVGANTFPNAYGFTVDNIAIKTAPEPSSLLLLACGLGGFIAWRWRANCASLAA